MAAAKEDSKATSPRKDQVPDALQTIEANKIVRERHAGKDQEARSATQHRRASDEQLERPAQDTRRRPRFSADKRSLNARLQDA
ncbi:hypothetical protein M440DRAFT_1402391 [Trichoderma longibrachiatum ATCC 18648]|uniref:Uncharacterized protein n=1 Tax=Trichoderma longibrachiatum ATCC 18648 TaxID=983965 RepID=A0A2T4C2R9_TRILO|nr:hypothetical protein M440DRAFT_1402391 [Trichoderma longibrachiatum ATCC 18648]